MEVIANMLDRCYVLLYDKKKMKWKRWVEKKKIGTLLLFALYYATLYTSVNSNAHED